MTKVTLELLGHKVVSEVGLIEIDGSVVLVNGVPVEMVTGPVKPYRVTLREVIGGENGTFVAKDSTEVDEAKFLRKMRIA